MRLRIAVFYWVVLGIALSAVEAHPPAPPSATMQGVLLGTGFPAPGPERPGPSIAVFAGQKVFIVDTGRGVG